MEKHKYFISFITYYFVTKTYGKMLNMVGTHILGMCNRIVPIHLQVLVLYNKYNILLLSHSKEIQLVFFSTY